MVDWIDALARTRKGIAGSLRRIFRAEGAKGEVSNQEIEETLLAADVPVGLAAKLAAELDQGYGGPRVSRRERLAKMLTSSLGPAAPFSWTGIEKPHVILVLGVNGSGKTTTCAKLADQAIRHGLKPLLGATDTFRAAGADQLRWWADRLGCEVVAGSHGGDAAAVAFDAVDAAAARGCDVAVIDTAGRMHTREPLMRELRKVRNALGKRLPGAPHETWIVLDATSGQNAVVQARVFREAVPLTGAIVTKLDGSSKGGFVFAIAQELALPIRFAALGEGQEDLVVFDPERFVDGLMAVDRDADVVGGG